MTGFGKAQLENTAYSVSVEIKALNSKFFDANVKLPRLFMEKELELRNLLAEKLERGKLAVIVDFVRLEDTTAKMQINHALFKTYFQEFQKLSQEVGANPGELFKLVLQTPDVMVMQKDNADLTEEWTAIRQACLQAIGECDDFRNQEGQSLELKLSEYAKSIETLLNQVPQYENERVETIRTRLKQNMQELLSGEEIDKNRFEQELIYYLEKYDVSEEKTRLSNHIQYFRQMLESKESNGKKLGFISQEMGREINTLGAKANHSEMQKLVVQMKDELEKIKEQVLNVL